MSPLRRMLWVLGFMAFVIVAGTTGYMLIEGWSFLDAIYMTIITITTVGYDEVQPLTDSGRVFSIFLMIGGVGGALYFFTITAAYLIEGQFGTTLGRRQMKNRIARLKEHFIVCGYGQVGQEIAGVFAEEKVPFVIIDKDPDSIASADKDGHLNILADATSDEALKEAGIERARGLVIAIASDADSTYITLSARQLRPDLFIEARISSSEAETKLKKAGADRIIDPHSIGARRMAMLALRPAVIDFIDTVTRRRGQELQLENIAVTEGSFLVGLKVEEAGKHSRASILAISKRTGKLLANPSPDQVIEAGDRLIAMGTEEQLLPLEKICERC